MAAKKKIVKKKVARKTTRKMTRRPAVPPVRVGGVRVTQADLGGLKLELDRPIAQRIGRLVGILDRYVKVLQSQLVVVCLQPEGPDRKPHLSRARRDSVVWKNDDDHAVTITFDVKSPLEGFPSGGITIQPGCNSEAYPVRADAVVDSYVARAQPPYVRPGSGPDEPVIIVED